MPAIITNGSKKKEAIPRVMILRGPPASGKTAVARKLAPMIPVSKKAYVSVDELQHCDLRKVSRDKLKLGVYHAALLTRSFVQEGFDVVVDYVFDQDLDFFVEKLFRSHISKLAPCVAQVFYLDASFEALVRRNKNRESPMRQGVLRELYDACGSTRGTCPGEVVIDTNRLTVKRVAATILAEETAILGEGSTGRIRPVDKTASQ